MQKEREESGAGPFPPSLGQPLFSGSQWPFQAFVEGLPPVALQSHPGGHTTSRVSENLLVKGTVDFREFTGPHPGANHFFVRPVAGQQPRKLREGAEGHALEAWEKVNPPQLTARSLEDKEQLQQLGLMQSTVEGFIR